MTGPFTAVSLVAVTVMAPVVQEGPATVALVGAVVDTSDTPLQGAGVHLAGTAVATRTDSTGVFRLAAVPDSTSILTVHHAGYAPRQFALSDISAVDERLDLGTVVLWPGSDVLLVADTLWPQYWERDRAPRLRYPERARRDGVTGWVYLAVTIGTDGEIVEVDVLGAEPAGVFEEAARETMMGSTFKPAATNPLHLPIVAEIVTAFSIVREE